MAQVLLVGIDPDGVDYSDPSLPPGLNAEVIRLGVARALEELGAAGHVAAHCYIPADPAGLDGLTERLRREAFDCVVVGGGVRLPPRHLVLFEAVLNLVAGAASRPTIVLVSRPDGAPEAVARVMRRRS